MKKEKNPPPPLHLNQSWITSKDFHENPQISRKSVRPVGAALIHADAQIRRTDMMKATDAFVTMRTRLTRRNRCSSVQWLQTPTTFLHTLF